MSEERMGDSPSEFATILREHGRYPLTIIQTDTFQHTLDSYRRRLDQEKVFHESQRWFYLWDLEDRDGVKNYVPSANLRSVEDLDKCLNPNDEDPRWRFVFMKSSDSRGPLACTKDHITLLFTYCQVMPSFLDHVFTFKSRAQPLAHAFFRHENFLEQHGNGNVASATTIPGRSGVRLQHGFNLLSIENSNDAQALNPWLLRQTALYHSFDMKTGKSTWFVLKGNDLILKYMRKNAQSHPLLMASAITSPETSFVASLQVHLIILHWCGESWSEYLDFLEKDVDKSTNTSKMAPVAAAMTPKNMSRMNSMRSTGSKRNSFPREQTPTTPPRPGSPFRQLSFPQLGRSLSDLARRWRSTSQGSFDSETAVAEDEEDEDDDELIEFDLEENFSIGKLQDLTKLGAQIESRLQVLEQNKGVIGELVEQYEAVVESHGFKSNIKVDECQGDLAAFFRKTKSTVRELDRYHSRLSALLRTVEHSKSLFQAIRQDKSEKTSELFANNSRESADRMEVWTKKMHTLTIKTKHETLSMHVITIFTLLFLPGTFLATFFSSGVLHWDEETKVEGDYAPRKGALRLFFGICIPMMAIILVGWLWMLRRMKKTLEDEENRVAMQGVVEMGEKGKAPSSVATPESPGEMGGLGIRTGTMGSIKE